MARWLGIDHGSRRIGVALGDTETGICSPLETLPADRPGLPAAIRTLAHDYRADGIVVGWPLNADGSEGPQGVLTRQFAIDLEAQVGMDVRLWDEYLSSFEADVKLRGTGTRLQKRARQDAVAAAAIVQDFFRGRGPELAPRAHAAAAPTEKRRGRN